MPRPAADDDLASSSFTFSEASDDALGDVRRLEPASMLTLRPLTGRSADLFCLERLWPDQHDRRLFVGFIEAELAHRKYGTLATNPPSFARHRRVRDETTSSRAASGRNITRSG